MPMLLCGVTKEQFSGILSPAHFPHVFPTSKGAPTPHVPRHLTQGQHSCLLMRISLEMNNHSQDQDLYPGRTSIAIIHISKENNSWTLIYLELYQFQKLQNF